jgi:hypothetical protein
VDTYGPHYAPLFEALEHQLNRARNTASVVERAKRVLDQHPEYPPWEPPRAAPKIGVHAI